MKTRLKKLKDKWQARDRNIHNRLNINIIYSEKSNLSKTIEIESQNRWEQDTDKKYKWQTNPPKQDQLRYQLKEYRSK